MSTANIYLSPPEENFTRKAAKKDILLNGNPADKWKHWNHCNVHYIFQGLWVGNGWRFCDMSKWRLYSSFKILTCLRQTFFLFVHTSSQNTKTTDRWTLIISSQCKALRGNSGLLHSRRYARIQTPPVATAHPDSSGLSLQIKAPCQRSCLRNLIQCSR